MARSSIALVAALVLLAPGVVGADPHEKAEVRCDVPSGGCFLARDGSGRDAARAYRKLMKRHRPAHLRTWIEMAAALGSGTAWYWLDRERQVADWDFPSVKQRLNFEAWRFDNNPFPINFFWHAFNGVGFHVIARSNDLSLPASVGVGFATSMAWEYLLEFREKVSINDVITTTGSGVVVGEFFHWLGRYLNSARRPSARHQAAAWSLGLWRSIHNRVDGRVEPHAETDALGLNADIWHRFHVGYGLGSASALKDGLDDGDGAVHWLSARGRLAALPGYLRPGRFRQRFAHGNVNTLSVRADIEGDGVGFDVLADSILLGVHAQSIPERGTGFAVTYGANMAYHFRKEKHFGWSDRLGLMHLPGPAVDLHAVHPQLRARLSLRANPDFVGLHAMEYGHWDDLHPDAKEKTILRKHGYYYGWGYSTRIESELVTRYAELGSAIRYGRFFSAEGFDRSQEDIDADIKLDDTVLDLEAWLRVAPMGGRLFIETRLTQQRRTNTIDGLTGDAQLTRLILQLGARL